MLRDLFGLGEEKSKVAETPDEDLRQQPCNETGHDWPEWTDDPFSPKAKNLGAAPHDLKVYIKMSRNCTKCDKYDNKNKTLGYINVDDIGNLSVVDR